MTTIFREDFFNDGNGTRYTASSPDSLLDIASEDWFGVITNAVTLPPASEYFDSSGNRVTEGFYGVEDINGAIPFAPETLELSWTDIDISNFENLSFTGVFAEDDDGTNEDWDTDTSLIVSYSIDGGAFQNLLAFEAEADAAGNQTNKAPRVDTDFDGIGDGSELTSTFSDFSAAIAGVGSSLDIRIALNNFGANDEDVAIDGFSISGDAVSVTPSPFTFELLHFADQEANAATIDNIDN
ncbi:MAG: hypothetical protein AAFS01_11895, partial [Pseudomonadota bacterium]